MVTIIIFYRAMIFVITLLLLLCIFYWSTLIRKTYNEYKYMYPFAKTILISCNFYFLGFLAYRWFQNGYAPLSNLYESLIFLAWCLTGLQFIISTKTTSRVFSAVLTPIEFLIVTLAYSLPQEMQIPAGLVPALQSNWLMLHVSMMILSYAILILGSLLSIVILILFLKRKRQEEYYEVTILDTEAEVGSELESAIDSAVNKINNEIYDAYMLLIENLDTWSYRLIGLGYIALTLGILAGAVWANEAWGSYWSWDPKETWSLITWLIFTGYLHVRLVNNWQGFETAFIGSIGFISIWISYLGVNFLASGLHSYGWIK